MKQLIKPIVVVRHWEHMSVLSPFISRLFDVLKLAKTSLSICGSPVSISLVVAKSDRWRFRSLWLFVANLCRPFGPKWPAELENSPTISLADWKRSLTTRIPGKWGPRIESMYFPNQKWGDFPACYVIVYQAGYLQSEWEVTKVHFSLHWLPFPWFSD